MRVLAVLAGFLSVLSSAGAVYASEPTGVWLTDGGRSLVDVADCEQPGSGQAANGQSGQAQSQTQSQPQRLPKSQRILCSKIVWLKQPVYENGQPLLDRRNENPELRSRTILGTPILMGLRFGEEGYWKGKVYNPEDGKTYAVYVAAEDKETLTVKGCAQVLFSEVCRTKTWTRATQEMLASAMPGYQTQSLPNPSVQNGIQNSNQARGSVVSGSSERKASKPVQKQSTDNMSAN